VREIFADLLLPFRHFRTVTVYHKPLMIDHSSHLSIRWGIACGAASSRRAMRWRRPPNAKAARKILAKKSAADPAS